MIWAGVGQKEARIKEVWGVDRWNDDRITKQIRFPSLSQLSSNLERPRFIKEKKLVYSKLFWLIRLTVIVMFVSCVCGSNEESCPGEEAIRQTAVEGLGGLATPKEAS